MKNLELKAKYPNSIAFKLVSTLPYSYSDLLIQEDTYFNTTSGRLKLRSINNKNYELIFYSRPDNPDAKESNYEIYQTLNPVNLTNILTLSYGVLTVVKKTRNLFIYKDCRIHIDKVEDLGDFIEFEVVMTPQRTASEAQKLMEFLIKHFNIEHLHLISDSYSDMLIRKNMT